MIILRHIYQKKAISECARCTMYICGNVSYKREHVLVCWVKWTYTTKIFLKDKGFRQWKAQELSKYDYFYNSTLRWFWETLLRSGVNPEVVYFLLILFLNSILSQSERNQHTVSFLVNQNYLGPVSGVFLGQHAHEDWPQDLILPMPALSEWVTFQPSSTF